MARPRSPGNAVLLVEDDEPLRVMMTAVLNRAGFSTECARDGKAALARLEESSFDAIVLDLMMPVMDGFDVMSRLKERQPSLLRRVVIATGVAESVLHRFDEATVFALLRKPFDIHELVETLHACASQGETRAKPRRHQREREARDITG